MLSKINKPMASFKLVFLFILVSFIINFLTAKAMDDIGFSTSCSDNKTTPNSAFQFNLRTLFSYLSSNATANKGYYYNTTIASTNHSDIDSVYGMFMCRGDVPSQLCSQCVTNATHSHVLSDPELGCPLSKEVMIWNEECMVRYSNRSFFSTVDLSPPSSSCSSVNVSNKVRFERLVLKTMNKVADEAANFSIGVKKYATKEARISGFQTLYCLAQCTPDLSPQDCRKCLNVTIASFQSCKYGNMEMIGRFETSSCYVRYDLYPFYRSTALAPSERVPASSSDADSKYSQSQQHPTYLSHNCSSNETINDGTFFSDLRTLFSSLSSKATTETDFFKTTNSTVNGLFMCRGDVSPTLCQLCVQDATQRISSHCPSSKEAIIWYDQCLLRYSYRSLAFSMDTTSAPKFHHFNMVETSNPTLLGNSFISTLAETLLEVKNIETEDNSTKKYYGTRSVKLNDQQTLYTLAQCTPDLSESHCGACLDNIFGYEIPWCCLESPEGKILYPNCYMMFGLSQFYREGTGEPESSRPPSSPPTTTVTGFEDKTNSSKKHQNMFIIAVPIVASAVLLSFCYYLLRKKARKSNYKTLLRKNFGDESTALEGLQFDLTLIKAATNNFSHENKIGKGGFGEVYKGILRDGRHIAVKRLLRSSKQGIVEFKTEILLIARLQQRNLVALIGFCLEEQEKILIYEFMPNKSLDYFLFCLTLELKLFN